MRFAYSLIVPYFELVSAFVLRFTAIVGRMRGFLEFSVPLARKGNPEVCHLSGVQLQETRLVTSL
ncbi:MAG: hypothetical protein KIT45_12375, partial [Fimbriimonadia bacterium]|nr:hypothetical protein [Fimbriimonadia bacterium]